MFNQKKILVLITGKLRFLDQKNILRLKSSFENFKLDFFVLAWKGQKQSIIDEFKKHYKPIFYHEIDEYNDSEISLLIMVVWVRCREEDLGGVAKVTTLCVRRVFCNTILLATVDGLFLGYS